MAYFRGMGFCFILSVLSTGLAAQNLVISKVDGAKEQLILSILELAVAKADDTIAVRQLSRNIPIARRESDVATGSLSLMWAGSSSKLDQALLAVRIPLLKGMLGHRIFIIRNGDQARFDGISDLSGLKRLNAGMGRTWGSTKVLKDAGLNVISTLKYVNLFPMLEGGRFDYFPRAVHEPWSEIADRPELDLAVEQKLLLIYPYAMYFYVAKNNFELHDFLVKGLEAAISDGSFDELFYSHPMVRTAIEKAKLRERTVIRIDNQDMHPDTPVDRPELWLDVDNL